MSRRLYLGRLPPDARSDEVQAFFNGYGKITDCRVMSGFGFIEFESSRDADDVVRNFNGKTFQGSNIIVEFAKEARGRRENYDAPPRSRRPPGVRLIVSGISRDTSWQDLKDFAREAGSVSFADIDRETQGQGIIEYTSRDDAERAVKMLEGKDLRGQPVRVALSEDRGGEQQYRREDRRGDRSSRYDREDREYRGPPREDRYGGSRGGPNGRDRSRSPGRGRGEYERGGHPQRYEDRRGGGGEYEDRRGGGAPPEAHGRRREERRDDRPRGDPAYGDARQPGGW